MKDDFFNGKPRTLALITAVILLVSGISFAGASEHPPDLTGVRLLDSGGADLAGRTVEADAAIGLEYTYGEALDSNPATDISSSYDEEIPVEVPPEIDLTNAVFHGADGTVTGSHKALVRVSRTGGTFRIDAGFDCAEAAYGGTRELRFPLTDREETIRVEIVPTAALYDATPVTSFADLVQEVVIYKGANENSVQALPDLSTIKKDDQLWVRYNLKQISTNMVTNGQRLRIEPFPEGLVWAAASGSQIELKGTNIRHEEQKFATLEIGSDGKSGAIVFENTFNEMLGTDFDGALLDAYLYVGAKAQADPVPADGKIQVKWNSDTILTINVEEFMPKASELKKEGAVVNGVFKWTLAYTPGKKQPVPEKLVDSFDPSNQAYVPGSFKVNGSSESDPAFTDHNGRKQFEYSPLPPPESPVIITYKTTPTDEAYKPGSGAVTVENKAWMADSSGNEMAEYPAVTKRLTLQASDKTWIDKTGTYDASNPAKRVIHWEIKISTLGRNLRNLTLVDDLPAGLEQPENVAAVPSAAHVHTITGSTDEGYHLEYPITRGEEACHLSYTVTYDTPVPDSYYNGSAQDRTFQNNAKLTFDWLSQGNGTQITHDDPTVGKGVKVTTNMIQKTGKSYDPKTHRITWGITVNPYGVDLTGYTITLNDLELSENKQKYVEIKNQSGGTISVRSADVMAPVFQITDLATGKATFDLVTELTDPDDFVSNSTRTYNNRIQMNATHSSALPINSEATGQQRIQHKILAKRQAGDYNFETCELTWEIKVNEDGLDLGEVTVTDELPEGLFYVPGSLTVGGASVTPTKIFPLTITIPDCEAVTTVKFRTRVDVERFPDFKTKKEVSVSNTAKLKTSKYNGVETETAGAAKIRNQALRKKGEIKANGPERYISYNVEINPNAVAFLGNEKLTDTLGDGLELDIFSVKLYKATVNASGMFAQGDPVTLTKGVNFEYGNNKKSFTVTMPKGAFSYMLQYDAYITEAKASYANRIEFSGGFSSDAGQGSESVGGGGGGGGGSSGNAKGSVKIIKTDEADAPLPGVTFTLGPDTAATDAAGVAIFEGLRYGTYTVVESVPAGYALDTDEAQKLANIRVNPYDDACKNIEISLKNRKLPSTPSDSSSSGGSGGGGPSSSSGSSGGSGGGMLTPPSQPGKAPENGESAQPPDGETITETTPPDTPKDGVIEAPRDSHFVLTAPPKSGTVVVNGDGTWNYTPVSGFRGTDSFVVEVREPGGKKRPVNVLVTIDDPLVPKGVPNTGGGRTTR